MLALIGRLIQRTRFVVVLLENGEVYTFGSNSSGQLGINDSNHIGPVRVNISAAVVQIAAGSNHTVALAVNGDVYTFGNNSVSAVFIAPAVFFAKCKRACGISFLIFPKQKNQLGRNCATFVQTEGVAWHSVPQLIPNVGAKYQQKVSGIGGSGDLTYLKISKSVVNQSTLQCSTFVADKNHIR